MRAEREEKKQAEMDDEEMWDSDSDDDSDSDSSEGKKKQKPKSKKLNPKKATLSQTKKLLEDEKKRDFFGDL